MKSKKSKTIVTVFIAAAILTIASVSAYARSNKAPINQDGLTYGIVNLDDFANNPDLIQAVGKDGTEGYVYSSDLFVERGETPEEALRLQAERIARGPYAIPLYAFDGRTIIGEFWMYPPIEVPPIEAPSDAYEVFEND